MEAKRRSQWLKSIVAVGLGLTLLGLDAGGTYAGQRTKGTAAPDACDIQGAQFGEPGTVVTDVLDQGGFVACLDKATNREALDCVAQTANSLLTSGGSDRIDLDGDPIWLVPKTPPQPWACTTTGVELPFCVCDGNDDCVALILFGPCEGGTMQCGEGDDENYCTCTY
jgi:hypothetical protein